MEEGIYHLYHKEEDRWWWSVGRRALVTKLWRRFSPMRLRPALLEVGCGTGGLLGELCGWADACGLDVSPEAVGYCRQRGLRGVCQGSLALLPYRDGSFDGVIAVDVLEHLDDDEGALREMFRVCRPGGLLIATVPAFQFLWSRRDEQLHHKRRYTRGEFQKRVAGAGFRVVRSTYLNPQLLLPLLLIVWAGRITGTGPNLKVDYALVPEPINRLMSGIVRLEAGLVTRVSFPVGTSIGCVALKDAG